MLSGLGQKQLARVQQVVPRAVRELPTFVYPERLLIHAGTAIKWSGVTWETLLTAFAASSNAWVAETATAWLEHLAGGGPRR